MESTESISKRDFAAVSKVTSCCMKYCFTVKMPPEKELDAPTIGDIDNGGPKAEGEARQAPIGKPNGQPVSNGRSKLHKLLPAGVTDKIESSVSLEILNTESKGRGCFTNHLIRCGDVFFRERPLVIGPKSTSPLVCIECLATMDPDRIRTCSECGVPLCEGCQEKDELVCHREECRVFQEAGVKYAISKADDATRLYLMLTPLRLLLSCDQLTDLEDKLEDRKDTVLFCFTHVNVVKYIRQVLKLERFSQEQIHRAAGTLDTNCYELGWTGTRARGLYHNIAYINHDCAPNCWKFFDDQKRMCLVASRDIAPGEELSLSYTPPMMCTPVRQVILQQTKRFTCTCDRCRDPFEFGAGLSALKCSKCQGERVVPQNPLDLKTDLKCMDCQEVVEAGRAKMMVDTAMKFLGSSTGNATAPEVILETITHLRRFLAQTHQLMIDLKIRYITQVIEQELSAETERAIALCREVIGVVSHVAPGKSRFRGIMSRHYQKLIELQGKNNIKMADQAFDTEGFHILTKEELKDMFHHDVGFVQEYGGI